MRGWLHAYLDGCHRAADIDLVATELASNAVCHTASAGWLFAVTVERDRSDMRVTVEDLGGSGMPEVQNPSDDDAGGHGLALVHELSDAWGASGDCLGRDVWAVWHIHR